MKRLNVDDPQVFDTWRQLYYDLTEAEQEQFGIDMEAKYPHQVSFTLSNYELLFQSTATPNAVLEIGGWKGELATEMLSRFSNISSWTNIDYCKPATEKTICTDPRYSVIYPDCFHWFRVDRHTQHNVFIAAHVIEHLTSKDLVALMDYITGIPIVMFEAPIPMQGPVNWTGYVGTHILEWGWQEVNAEMEKRNYVPNKINDNCFLYEMR